MAGREFLRRFSKGIFIEGRLQMKAEDVIGKTSTEIKLLRSDERTEGVKEIMEQGGSVSGMEMKLRIGTGEEKDFITSIEIIEIDHEKCFLAAFVDISERKKLEQDIKILKPVI